MNSCVAESKINNQTILEEQNNDNYEPTEEEIREYALYIGIDPEQDDDLLWLAREGILQALPHGWKPCQDEQGELYYFNFETGQSSWDHPFDDINKRRVIQEREKRKTSENNKTSPSHSLDVELVQFRQRIEQSTDDEKLQILEEHRLSIETFRKELQQRKEREERLLREQMQKEVKMMESNLRQMFNTRNLEQQTKINSQLQHDYDEKHRQIEHRHKKEIDHLTHRSDQSQRDREKLEKRLKEKNELCAHLRRTIDQLHAEKALLERRCRRQDEDDEEAKNKLRETSNDDDLSESDSDLIEMRETFQALKPSVSLIDSGHWSNSFSDRTYQSQSSLITREAVFRAARDLLPPGVIDHLSFNSKSSIH